MMESAENRSRHNLHILRKIMVFRYGPGPDRSRPVGRSARRNRFSNFLSGGLSGFYRVLVVGVRSLHCPHFRDSGPARAGLSALL